MAQHALEIILLRQLSSYLAVPIWINDELGNLLFYNEPAENLLGVSFGDAGPINSEKLTDLFKVTTLEGEPVESSDFPVTRALHTRKPDHGSVRFQGFDGVEREVGVTAIPITGQGDRFLGVMTTFWELAD